MKEYAHIDTIWKRDMERKGVIIPGEFASPELEYLAYNQWIGTEKVDGTNIRVMWDGRNRTFGGKTDNAQLYSRLVVRLEELFTPVKLAAKFPGESLQVCLYGEGFGAGIQRGGKYLANDAVDFALFDVKVGDWWLKREAVEDIAAVLGLTIVPVVFTGNLYEACEWVKNETISTWSVDERPQSKHVAEGLVLNPTMPLLKRNGDRVIAKIKSADYVALGRMSVQA